MKEIYKKTQQKKLTFRHVCEVGVYLPETSNVLDYIKENIRTTLVEADPVIIEKIKKTLGNYTIQLFPFAVWDFSGTLKFSKANASTFVSELAASPALVNDGYQVSEEQSFEVPCRQFSDFDDGTIELLSVDVEGSEWYVLKYMKSRPQIISIETHGKYYVNPFITQILDWTQKNGYSVWFKDDSDTVFVRNDVFVPTAWEKFLVKLKEFSLATRRLKRFLKP